jgi:hypothetical protein
MDSGKSLSKHLQILGLLGLLVFPLAVWPQTEKIVVTAEEADIYAEPYLNSYLVDTVKQGTVLSLFQKSKVNEIWYYVRFESQRYGGPAMGFIKDSLVAPYTGELPPAKKKPEPGIPPLPEPEQVPPPETKAKAEAEKPPPEKKEAKAPPAKPVVSEEAAKTEVPPPKKKDPVAKKAVEKLETQAPEPRKTVVTIEESDVDTSLPPRLTLPAIQAVQIFPDTVWLQIRSEQAPTAPLSSRYIQLPRPPSELESRMWPVPKPAPPPKVEPEEKTPVPAEKPVEKAPVKPVEKAPEIPAEKAAPAAVELSPQIALTRGTDSFVFQLRIGAFASYASFELPNPNRVVFDFNQVEQSAGFDRRRINDLGIDTIRVGMFADDIARVVFDFQQEIPAYQIEQTDDGLKVLFWSSKPLPEAEPETPVGKKPAPPNPKPEAVEPKVEEISRSTSIPLQQRFTLAEPISPPRPRLFLLIEGDDVDTQVPVQTLGLLPAYSPPVQETYWLVTRVEPLQDTPRPKSKALELPTPKAKLEDTPLKKTPAEKPAGKKAESKKPETEKPAPKPKEEPTKKPEEKDQVILPPEQIKPPIQPTLTPPGPPGPPRLLLGFGYGASKGGMGSFIQFQLSENLALHAGGGYFPTTMIYSETDWVENAFLYSAGIKLYGPLLPGRIRAYLNLQYGGFAVEAVQIIEGIYNYQFVFRNEQKALFGPQALVGGEISLGRLGLNAAAGAAYALTDWEWLTQKLYFTFDVGLLFRLK